MAYGLWLVVNAGIELGKGNSPYNFATKSPFRYSPLFAMAMVPLQWIALRPLGVAVTLLSFLAMARIHWILLQMFAKEFGFSSKLQVWLGLLLPWLIVMQGIAAQIEGGNPNLFLIYLTIEGVWQYSVRPIWGEILMSLCIFAKPQLLALPALLAIRDLKTQTRSWFISGGIILLMFFVPFVLGFDRALQLYRDWNLIVAQSSLANLFNRIGNGNLSLFSFFVRIGSLSPTSTTILILIPAFLLTLWVTLRSGANLVLLSVGLWFTFLFSPVSFAYSQLTMIVLGSAALLIVLGTQRWKIRRLKAVPLLLFLLGFWGLTYDVVGKRIFESLIVTYRVIGWFTSPLILCFCSAALTSNNKYQNTGRGVAKAAD